MSLSRIRTVAADEFALTLRRPMTWTLIVILFLIAWGMAEGTVGIAIGSGDAAVGGKKAFLNSEFALTQMVAIFAFSFFGFFLTAAAGSGIIRDDESRILELLQATPLRPSEYAWGKFIGVMAAYIVVLFLMMLFLVVFLQVIPNDDMLETRGPFVLANYLRPTLLFGVPSLLFYGGVTFGIGAATRRAVLTFAVPIILTIFASVFLWSWSPTWLTLSMNRALQLADPAGVRWLRETWLIVDRGAEFYNTQSVGVDVLLVANRLLWTFVGLAAAALGVAAHVRRARASHVVAPAQVAAALEAGARVVPPEALVALPTPLAALRMRGGASSFVSTMVATARAEARELGARAGLYLFVPLILVQVIANAVTALGVFDAPLLSTPGQVATTVQQVLALTVTLLLVFYGVESLERERAARLDALQDAYPLSTGAFLAGKLIALALIWLVIVVAALLAAFVIVKVQGPVPFSLTPFAVLWGAFFLPTFLAFATFVFAAWALAGNRYTAYAVALLAFGVTIWADLTKRLTWITNWIFTTGPVWSDMGMFEFDRTAIVLNRLLWLSVAVLFWAVAVRWYPRRARDVLRSPLVPSWRGTVRGTARALPVLALPLLLSGMLWTRIESGPGGDRAEKRDKDYWKKNLATWRGTRPPWLATADLDVDIDPVARTWRVKGSYVVRNQRDTTLRTLGITIGRWRDVRWTLDGQSASPDTASRLHVFTLARPLAKDDSVRVGFSYMGDVSAPTKAGGGASEFITPSGVVMTSFNPEWFPLLGYVESIGVDDEENGFETRRYPDDWYAGETGTLFGSARPSVVSMRITVPAHFVANGVGEKVGDVVTNGRRTVTWKTERPVMAFNIVAGRLAERRGTGTALYYHPAHTYNVDEIIDAMDNARRWYGTWFGEYPWKTLKISEFPSLAGYAQGFPTNISFSERIGFLTKSEPKTYLAFLVTAHEIAHQWWGNMLTPGNGPGANILSEGLSHFSTALLIEQVKGVRGGMEFRQRIESRYGNDRRADAERKLYLIDGSRDGDNTVTYDKGGWVFWMLADLMGRERALTGLRDLIAKFDGTSDHAAVEDLTAHMRGYAPDTVAYDAFVRQWFDSVVVPEYRIEEAVTRKLAGNDGWETTVTVHNVGTGRMPIDVAVTRGERFPDDTTKSSARPYAQATARTMLGADERATLRIRSPFEPDKAVVDPDIRVLQLRRKLAVRSLAR